MFVARNPKLEEEDEDEKEHDGRWTFRRVNKIARDRLIVVDGEDDDRLYEVESGEDDVMEIIRFTMFKPGLLLDNWVIVPFLNYK